MGGALQYIFESGDFWAILVKVLITAVLTGLCGLCGTLIGKILSKLKFSKIKKHADIAVAAAEQKFPNEGTKMGPEKMAYVMDYLAITFPKIKSNQYLYNIAEAAVLELNKDKQGEAAKKEFKEKYGDLPESSTNTNTNDDAKAEEIPPEAKINSLSTTTVKKEQKKIMNIF